MQLESYVAGKWQAGAGSGVALRDATTGEVIANASADGLDSGVMLEYAREVGGPNLRKLTFHERAALLKALARDLSDHKDGFYPLSYATGATKGDSWIDIDGGISTLFVYASKGTRELPNSRVYVDGGVEALSKSGTFVGQHVCVPLEGAAIHINAFNFPVWGMLEKLAPALLAGVPAIVKPATQTCYLAERVFRRIVESAILPQGAVQLVCGGVGELFERLTCQDAVSFTGSATTALKLRQHPVVSANSVRFTSETDSLNSSVLGPDAGAGTPELELFVREVVREMTVKAGQKCTAIRKAIVPAARVTDVLDALRAALGKIVVGDPRLPNVRMGPVASLSQRREVLEQLAKLKREAEVVYGDAGKAQPLGADADRGAFVSPTLLYCRDAGSARAIHSVEAFGPVCTVVPYDTLDDAIALARRGGGSLAGSIFSADDAIAARLVLGLAPFHGRMLVVNRHCAGESTGHGSPLPHLVHGGPGRAGGGEEMGGIRGVLHYMQRTALQGSPTTLMHVTNEYIAGAERTFDRVHPFRKYFDELEVGDALVTARRTVTEADIVNFAGVSGDFFYAHMDDIAARDSIFEKRVAHGYFVLSAAAGLFVDAAPGPVLANYGLESLRFVKPVYPGDTIQATLTCKQKTAKENREGQLPQGVVAWDVEVKNQADEPVAVYTILTLVRRRE